MATSVKVSGRPPRSKKVLKVLKIVQEHPEYTSGQIYQALRGTVNRQHLYGILAKYRSRLIQPGAASQNGAPQGGPQDSTKQLRHESLLQALALVKSCGGDVKNAILHVETVAALRNKA